MAFNGEENMALREGFNFDFDPVPPPSLSLPLTVGAGGYHEKESEVGEGDAAQVSLSLSPCFTLEMGSSALISVTRGFVPLQLKDFESSLLRVPCIQGAEPNSWVRPFVSPSLALAPCLRTPPASSWFQDHPVFLPARRRPHHLPRLPASGARQPRSRSWSTTPARVQLMRLRAAVGLDPLDSEATGLGSRSTNSLGRVAVGPDSELGPFCHWPSLPTPRSSVFSLLLPSSSQLDGGARGSPSYMKPCRRPRPQPRRRLPLSRLPTPTPRVIPNYGGQQWVYVHGIFHATRYVHGVFQTVLGVVGRLVNHVISE